MSMDITPDTIAWIGLFLGVLARVIVPYLRKLWAGEIKEFQIYYIWQGAAGLGLSLIVSVLLVPNITIAPDATFLQLIVANVIVGFGSTSLIAEIFALNELRQNNQTTTPTSA